MVINNLENTTRKKSDKHEVIYFQLYVRIIAYHHHAQVLYLGMDC